jgi:hypothetical protein
MVGLTEPEHLAKRPAMRNRHGVYARCRLHGGASCGPKTLAGLMRSTMANWKTGSYSAAALEARRPRVLMLGLVRFMAAPRHTGQRPRPRCACRALVDRAVGVLARALTSSRKLDRLAIMAAGRTESQPLETSEFGSTRRPRQPRRSRQSLESYLSVHRGRCSKFHATHCFSTAK